MGCLSEGVAGCRPRTKRGVHKHRIVRELSARLAFYGVMQPGMHFIHSPLVLLEFTCFFVSSIP